MTFSNQSDDDQFVYTDEVEKYIKTWKLPACQKCKKPIDKIKMTRIEGKGKLIHIAYDFSCHGKVLRFLTNNGIVARVEEKI
ncbi:hypothetical protein [Leptospira meyeri]|uniref:hypothetical protein n=1 Tax=Leptospira meyeri TaxID=29508 RepID=UPI0005932552|nr:hypothetical protein [Leptospira meyeri]